MKPNSIVAVMLASLLACGCASAPTKPFTWAKAGATYDDFLKDRYACIQDARGRASSAYAQGSFGAANSRDVVNVNIFKPCMASKGYRLDPNGFPPPPGGEVWMQ